MNVWIVTTGELLRMEGIRSSDSVLLEIISKTERKFLMAMFAVSRAPDEFWRNLEMMVKDGVETRVILDGGHDHDPQVISEFQKLSFHHSNFRWRLFGGESRETLHAKLIISDTSRVLISSANITQPGLFSNCEVGVYIENRKLAWICESLFLKLWNYRSQDATGRKQYFS